MLLLVERGRQLRVVGARALGLDAGRGGEAEVFPCLLIIAIEAVVFGAAIRVEGANGLRVYGGRVAALAAAFCLVWGRWFVLSEIRLSRLYVFGGGAECEIHRLKKSLGQRKGLKAIWCYVTINMELVYWCSSEIAFWW